MPRRVLIHAAVESPTSPWGGIASAIGLMTQADALTGTPSTVLAPGPAAGAAGPSPSDHVYHAADRLAAGAQLSRDLLGVLERTAGRSGVDVVVHNEELRDLLVGLRSDPNNRVVYYSHGLSSQEHPGSDELDQLQRDVLATGVPVLAASEQQLEALLRLRPAGPVRAVPPPLALHVVHSAAPRLPPREPLTIVAAGRAVSQKGLDLLLRALDTCEETVASADVYAGHGQPEYEKICRTLAARCRVPVRWRGWLPQEELMRVLPSYSALVMPSRFEPLGLLAAEAIGAGVPVAGSDTGGLSDLVRAGGGAPIPCGPDGPAPEDIATAIRSLPGLVPVPPEQALRRWSPRQYADSLAGVLELAASRG